LGVPVLIVALGLASPTLAATPASADTVVDECTIVSNPTAANFTNCPGVDLTGSDLSGIDLSFADLSGARFANCNFFTVTCNSADLEGAKLTNANLANAVFFASTSQPPPFSGSASGAASLDDADLSGADVSGANLEDGLLEGANLTGVDATGANLGGADMVDANLTDANLTGAITSPATLAGVTLTGAIITGTGLLPPTNQTWFATSNAGAVVTWQPLLGVPGASPGRCTPGSGSILPVGTTTVTCQVFDDQGNAATGTFEVTVMATHVVLPGFVSTQSGVINLDAAAFDAAGITKVVFELTGVSYTNQVIATGTLTAYGWAATWNTTTVPDGGYNLVSVATDANNVTSSSLPELFAVSNGLPATSVLVPSKGANVSGRASVLDASASPYVSTVTYRLIAQSYPGQLIATGTLTAYGWAATWNTTTVPNGTYSVIADASYPNGQNDFSLPVSITVKNPLPTTSILIPSKATTLSGSTYLDAAASNATSVGFLLFGGSYGFAAPVICTATATQNGWLCAWNSATVPNGSYVLVSYASNSAGSVASSGVSVTIKN
jgi:uncharacterized protein YjbI with pentapeptide repeats